MRTCFKSSFKIKKRSRKFRCRRIKDIHFLDTKLISYYLVSEVETLNIYQKPYCMEANGCNWRFHYETRCTKCGIVVVVDVIAKVRNINIQSSNLILMFLQNITKNMHKMIVLLIPRGILQSPFIKVEYSNMYFKISITGQI